ncbi:MAG: glycosyltransferase [Candidatus Parcubacteria bacterium]|nr:glycosyltransferase [Candidatus Parcubacteria bacterium]
MKIVQWCDYKGKAFGAMGSERVVEALTKGLLKLGHEVLMRVHPDSIDMPAPIITEIPNDFDIVHGHGSDLSHSGLPWCSTIHGGGNDSSDIYWKRNPHFICVSDFICKLSGNRQFVHSCVDPDDFIYCDKKDDYFLFLSGLDWGEGKGLFTVISLAKKMGVKLKIAAAGKNQQILDEVKRNCNSKIEYLGAVNGQQKAELISKAKAIILYTRLNDACPLVVAESLISGTPIIGSTNGSLPELIVNGQTGILCKNEGELPRAILDVSKINPENCRQYAMNNFSNLVACEKYLQLYRNMILYGDVNGEK